MLKIDEILWPIIIKARREEQRLTQFARPPSSICIVTPSNMSATRPDNPIPDTSFSTFAGGSISPLSHAGGPSQPIIIIDNDTTPPPLNALSSLSSSSVSSSRKRKGLPIRQPTSCYVRRMTMGLPNLGSSV